VSAPPAPSSLAPDPVHPLAGHPAVRRRLVLRGVALAPGEGEDPEAFRARLETALMALFRDRGGEEDFAALYEVGSETVLRRVAARMRGPACGADPLELLQDTFVNVYRYAASFRDEHPASFRAWVNAISANVVRRYLGERARTSLQALPEHLQEPADRNAGPVASLSVAEERLRLGRAWTLLLLQYAAAWRELSPRDRLALHLIEVEGYSYSRACERLRVRMSNMKMIMFRARKRVRARMARAMAAGSAAADARRRAG